MLERSNFKNVTFEKIPEHLRQGQRRPHGQGAGRLTLYSRYLLIIYIVCTYLFDEINGAVLNKNVSLITNYLSGVQCKGQLISEQIFQKCNEILPGYLA